MFLLMLLSIGGQLLFVAVLLCVAMLAILNHFKLAADFASPYPTIRDGKPKTKKPKGKESDKFFHPMALIKTAGTGVIAISGKIAGTVFCIGGQQGPFARVWAKPRNRRTALQTFARGILSGVATSWRALTAAQADAWNSAGSGPGVSGYNLRKNVFGDTRKISGSQLYQRVNNIILSIGSTVTATPPTTGTTDAVLSAVVAADASAASVDATLTLFGGGVVVPANTTLKVYATPQKGANQSYFGKSDYRLLATYPAGTNIALLGLDPGYQTMFGALVAGSRIGFIFEFVYHDVANNIFSKGGDVYATTTVVP